MKIALLLIFILTLSACALMDGPEEEIAEESEEVSDDVPDEEPDEAPDEDIDLNATAPETIVEPPSVTAGDVTFGEIALPSIVDIVEGEASLELTIPYTYSGDASALELSVTAALGDVRVVISGKNAETTIDSVDVRTNNVVVTYLFPQGPATLLTRIMYGASDPLSSRKRIGYLPKRGATDTTTTTTAPTPTTIAGVSDSFIRYGISDIIKDKNNDKSIIIALEDRSGMSFNIKIHLDAYGTNPTYGAGELDIEFEWLMLANEDATITWSMLDTYEYILFYPPYSQEKYVVAFPVGLPISRLHFYFFVRCIWRNSCNFAHIWYP